MVNLEKLFLENEGLIFAAFNKYFASSLEYHWHEEFLAVGRVGLWKACLNVENGRYNSKKGKFSTYAFWIIRGEMTNFARENYLMSKSKEVKYKTDYNLISFNTEVTGKDGKKVELGSFLIGCFDVDFCDQDYEELFKLIRLNRKEIEVLTLLLEGYKPIQVAEIKGVSRQMINFRIRTIKKKYENYKEVEKLQLQRVI